MSTGYAVTLVLTWYKSLVNITIRRTAVLIGCTPMLFPMWLGPPNSLSQPSSLTKVTTAVSPAPAPSPSGSGPIFQELQIIEQKIQNQKKNVWDYLSSFSAFLGGLLVAIIGAFATYIFNKRQRDAEDGRAARAEKAEDDRKDHELAITRIQTMQAFLPQLKSPDERDKEAAILAITSLDDKLMEKVATLYRGEGVVRALAKVARSESGAARIAKQALDEVLNSLQRSVVVVKAQEHDNSPKVLSGFVAADGRIITVTYILPENQPYSIRVQFRTGVEQDATIVARDDTHMLMVLATDTHGIAPLKIESTDLQSPTAKDKLINDPTIIVLGHQVDISRDLVSIGTILDVTEGQPGLAAGPLIVADLQTQPGFSGAPVVNTRGKVIGVSHATRDGRRFLIPAMRVAQILAQGNP